MARLPVLERDELSPAQSEVYHRIAAGARGGVRGPFTVLLHSPDLAGRVEQLGVYVRFQCAVPERLRELAICIVAAHWRARYEWFAHANLARRQGIQNDVLDAIARHEAPSFEREEESAVYDFCAELLRKGRVTDPTFDRCRRLLGDRGSVDLTGLVGYYSLLAMQLNAFEVAVPADADVPWGEVS